MTDLLDQTSPHPAEPLTPVAGAPWAVPKSRVRKYQCGRIIRDIHAVVDAVLAGKYLMVCGRPTHPSWVRSWQFSMLVGMVRAGKINEAQLTPEYKKAMKR